MSLPFKPHIIALLCSAGLLAAAGTLYVQSRTPATIAEPPAQQAPAPAASTTQPVAATYTQAQIDQWVAPIALYPDSLLSQVLMASTYPDNVLQAVQWSQDNPAMKGDAAVQAVASQPWDPSVKSLVAFPALLAMMGENPPWVENLGNAFLAQPHDVMDSVQRLRHCPTNRDAEIHTAAESDCHPCRTGFSQQQHGSNRNRPHSGACAHAGH